MCKTSLLFQCLNHTGQKIKAFVTNRVVLNRLSPCCFVFAASGIAGWGVHVAIPFLYSDFPRLQTWMITLGYFLAFQLFTNWLCMLLVDTSYHPNKDDLLYSSTSLTDKLEVVQNGHHHNPNTHQNVSIDISKSIGQAQDVGSILFATNYGRADLEEFLAARDDIDGTLQPTSTKTYCLWWLCSKCQVRSPPRCHHCGLCNKCILKRDHHCYVVATCVGYRNLRHFSVFVFYATLATVFAVVHALPYAYFKVIPNVSYVDLFYPIAVIRGMFGYVTFVDMILIVLGWMLLGYLIFSVFTLQNVFRLITTGMTTFEVVNHIDVEDVRDVKGCLRAVYGRYWACNYIFPLHFFYDPIDNPFTWPYLKINGQYVS